MCGVEVKDRDKKNKILKLNFFFENKLIFSFGGCWASRGRGGGGLEGMSEKMKF